VHRVQKFVEVSTGRIGYAKTAAALSEVSTAWSGNRTHHLAWPKLFLTIQRLLQCCEPF